MQFWPRTLKLIQRSSAVTPYCNPSSCELVSDKQLSGSPWPGGLHSGVALALDRRIGWLQGTLLNVSPCATSPHGATRAFVLYLDARCQTRLHAALMHAGLPLGKQTPAH